MKLTSVEVNPMLSMRQIAGRLAGNSTIYVLANFAVKAVGFLLLPLYSRFLTPADFGVVALAEILAVVVGLLSTLGLENGMQRLYFDYVSQPVALSHYVSTVLRSSFVLSAGILGLAFSAGPWVLKATAPNFSVAFYPYIALAIATAAATQLVQFRLVLYQVENRPMAYAGLASTLVASTAVAVIYFVVIARQGARGMLAGKFIATMALLVLSVVLARKFLLAGWQRSFLVDSLRLSLPQLPFQFAALGIAVADRLILEHYRPLAEVGIYSLAVTLGMTMSMVISSIALAWTPTFFELAGQGESGRRILGRLSTGIFMLMVAVATVGMVIAQDVVRLVFDQRYRQAGRVIPWIIAGLLLHGIFYLSQLSAVYAKKTKFLSIVGISALVVNVALNLLFIPRWGIYGAAYATLLGFVLESTLMFVWGQRLYYIPFHPKQISLALAVLLGVLLKTQIDRGPTSLLESAGVLAVSLGVLAFAARGDISQALGFFKRRFNTAANN